jgi:hypothetical protein
MVRALFHRVASQARGYEAAMKSERCGAAFAGGRAMGSASAPIRRTCQKVALSELRAQGVLGNSDSPSPTPGARLGS